MATLCTLVLAASGTSCARSSAPAGQRTEPHSAARLAWESPRRVASGPAERGPWRMNDSDYRWVDDPSVDLSDDDALVVWADQTRKDVFFRRYGPGGVARGAAPVNLSRTPATFSWLPRLVAGPECGAIHALWQEIVFSGGSHGGDIHHARSLVGGRSFSEPFDLSNSVAGDGKGRLDRDTWDNGSLDLACAPSGELYATWTAYEGSLWLRRSTDAGASFERALQLGGSRSRPARGPSVAVAARGDVYVAYAVGEGEVSPIHLRKSVDRGRTFAEPLLLGTPGAHADAPQIALGPDGTLHLAFAESTRGRSGPYQVRYARFKYGSTRFSAPRRLHLPAADGSEAFPTLSVDAKRVYVLWEVSAASEARARGLALSYSLDAGETFSAPLAVRGIAGARLGFNGSQQGKLMDKLASGRGGALAIVNSTFDPGEASHVWLLRARLKE
jgi:hypothetical protein